MEFPQASTRYRCAFGEVIANACIVSLDGRVLGVARLLQESDLRSKKSQADVEIVDANGGLGEIDRVPRYEGSAERELRV